MVTKKSKQQSARYRHGDVVIDLIDAIPAKAARVADNILARGDSTGHAHRFDGNGQVMRLVRSGTTELYLRVEKGGGRVLHEEHGPITLTAGEYRVTQKRQFRTKDGWATVQD